MRGSDFATVGPQNKAKRQDRGAKRREEGKRDITATVQK
jgi:hypothetical protein